MTDAAPLIGLFSEINNLKRIRKAGCRFSVAEILFRSAWAGLGIGLSGQEIAMRVTAHSVAGARLGAIDRSTLASAGLSPQAATEVLLRSFESVSADVNTGLACCLKSELSRATPEGSVPEFVDLLCEQPRAGATSPGKPRILLLPPESHGDHCFAVAAYSVLLSPRFGAAPEQPFLAGLAHHLHNAWLPDSGFSGEEMLGGHLEHVCSNFRSRAALQMEEPVRARITDALEATANSGSAEGKAFHAADVIDRVLQARWYEEAAGFQLTMAMDDMQLVHAGPVQAFHREILREAGLW